MLLYVLPFQKGLKEQDKRLMKAFTAIREDINKLKDEGQTRQRGLFQDLDGLYLFVYYLLLFIHS